MIFSDVTLTCIGLLAGSLLLTSSLPQILKNLRNPLNAVGQSPARNLLQAAGNAVWLVYGVANQAIEMMIFSSLGSVLATLLLIQTLRRV